MVSTSAALHTTPRHASAFKSVGHVSRGAIKVARTVGGRVRHVGVPPAEERRETDGERQGPDDGDGDLGAGGRHEQRVGDRATDGQVSVETDGAEVEDRRRADPDVDGEPGAAPDPAERPPAEQLVHATERQDHGAQHGPRDPPTPTFGDDLSSTGWDLRRSTSTPKFPLH